MKIAIGVTRSSAGSKLRSWAAPKPSGGFTSQLNYERLADLASGMDADGIPPVPAGPAQQQLMQQQQSKMTPEDEK